MRRVIAILAGLFVLLATSAAAQLRDEPPAERDAMVIGALFPGAYGNGEQTAFDARLNTPAALRAPPLRVTVAALDAPALGGRAYAVRAGGAAPMVYVPRLDAGTTTVRLAAYRGPVGADDDALARARLDPAPACDLLAVREAGQFRAAARGPCADGPNELLISERALWWRAAPDAPYARLNRARAFSCYADMPGSGGIQGEAFQRYDGLTLDDQGGEAWFLTRETPSRRLGLRLRAVDWPMNNKAGTFTRDSLTLYLLEQRSGGSPAIVTYAWTEPGVRRIGLNTIWLLANCFMESNALATPEF